MVSWLSKKALRLIGWHTSGKLPQGIRQAVLIVAPHTSYWDFVIGRLTFWASHVNVRFLIKKEVFIFPIGFLLMKLGGIPVARGKRKNMMIDQVVDLFRENEDFVMVITPEGTRRQVRQWKKGFYMIAVKAAVPIALGFIDYSKKTGGIGPVIQPTGNFDKDMDFITDFYKDKTPRHPERFHLPNIKKYANKPEDHP